MLRTLSAICCARLWAGFLFLLIALLALPATAQMGGFGRKGMGSERPTGMQENSPGSSDGVERLEHVITATGLSVAFPIEFACPPIASPYGSPERFDGSTRRSDRNSGLHGGMDISLPEGTPLLAIASGEVIAHGEGGRLEGIFLWLRHAPADTGLPFWVFAKYQHLSALPTLNVGDRVQTGEVIALSGSTGTAGGVFGSVGYPHLHLSTFYGPSAEYTKKGVFNSMVQGQGAVLDDPLMLYLKEVSDLKSVRNLSNKQKQVSVAVAGEDGAIYPAGSKSVWPVRCKRK